MKFTFEGTAEEWCVLVGTEPVSDDAQGDVSEELTLRVGARVRVREGVTDDDLDSAPRDDVGTVVEYKEDEDLWVIDWSDPRIGFWHEASILEVIG